ncbi:unnamed protein product [Adineta steineri]|uniref:Uncharacterized protein n=1 Tax=Adineta steineri TaxID=433720 RepID=A0A815SWT7_9BILA|nr:unnamed protein product [Adineta steineri]
MAANDQNSPVIKETDKEQFQTVEQIEARISSTNAKSNHTLYDSVHQNHYYNGNVTNDIYQNNYSSSHSIGRANDSIDNVVIYTKTAKETNEYLNKIAKDIHPISKTQIIREVMPQSKATNEQLVSIRFLKPPDLPPPGPLIIKEVRVPQPPTPPPIIIHECPSPPPTPPPLILRERPPTPPEPIPTETVTHYLPPTPPRPRSVIIKRYPALPEKQRKIIIERWIPYERQPERQVIVHPAQAPCPIKYPQPYYKTNPYGTPDAHIARRFEELVGRDYLVSYRSRYGSSFLVSPTPSQRDRDAGIFENSPSISSLPGYRTCPCGKSRPSSASSIHQLR